MDNRRTFRTTRGLLAAVLFSARSVAAPSLVAAAFAAAASAAAVVPAPAAAQLGVPVATPEEPGGIEPIPPSSYAERRQALLDRVGPGVILAFGGVEPVTYWPSFGQLPSFRYLTGFPEPDAVLVMTDSRSMLFVPEHDPRTEAYVGERMGPEEVEATLGLEGRSLSQLEPVVDSLLDEGLPLHVVSDVRSIDYAAQDSLTRGARFIERLRQDRPGLEVDYLDDTLAAMRARKSEAEIERLRRAAEISALAHVEAMKATTPGCAEHEIQALMEGAFRRFGGDGPGYGSIVGSGPNATILHYMENERVMDAGELLLIDAGAAYDGYSADITRTFPVSGEFTPDQRALYQIVLDAQAAYVDEVRPGATVAAANRAATRVLAEGLAQLGLIEDVDARFDAPWPCPPGGCPQSQLFTIHGYTHGIGLEVHDPAQFYTGARRFQPGDVFTVEPGLYVSSSLLEAVPETPRNRAMLENVGDAIERYRDLGIRIEDNYVVTESGVERITTGVPRQIDEIEALMRQPAPQMPGGGVCGTPVT